MSSPYNPAYSSTWDVCVGTPCHPAAPLSWRASTATLLTCCFPGPTASTDCPRTPATTAICSDRGTCSAAPGKLGGACNCTNGWTGAACNLTVVPQLNCTAQAGAPSAVYRYGDLSLNSIQVTTCSDGGACAPGHVQPCSELFAPNTTRDVVVPLATDYMLQLVCRPDGSKCFPAYSTTYTRSGDTWSPPLMFPDPGYAYCETTADCPTQFPRSPGAGAHHSPARIVVSSPRRQLAHVATTVSCVNMNVTTERPTWKACIGTYPPLPLPVSSWRLSGAPGWSPSAATVRLTALCLIAFQTAPWPLTVQCATDMAPASGLASEPAAVATAHRGGTAQHARTRRPSW